MSLSRALESQDLLVPRSCPITSLLLFFCMVAKWSKSHQSGDPQSSGVRVMTEKKFSEKVFFES